MIKWFIFSTVILAIMYLIQWLAYKFKNNSWSRKGFKEYSDVYLFYYIYIEGITFLFGELLFFLKYVYILMVYRNANKIQE